MTDEPSIMLRAAEWLLGLDRIRLGRDAPVHLQWNPPYAGWLILACVLAVLLVVILAYSRERGRPLRRIPLATLRAGLAGLVIALVCRPVLILQRNRVSPSQVALLIDTSASMSRCDGSTSHAIKSQTPSVAAGAPAGRRAARRRPLQEPGCQTELGSAIDSQVFAPADSRLPNTESSPELSRLDLVRRALTAADSAALRTLLRHNHVRMQHFAADVRSLGTARTVAELEPVLSQLADLTANGTSTNLAGALERVLGRTGGGRLAAVILASDGQSTEPGSVAGAIAAAKAKQVPIYPLLVGSPLPPRDVGIRSVTWDGNVFAKDILAVRVRLEATGLPSPTPVTVRLLGAGRGLEPAAQVVASETVELGGGVTSAEVELRTKPAGSGRMRYRVEVTGIDGDTDADNNADVVDVQVWDQPVRVLYVEQLPRFEYRYLKNALVREDTVRASVLLLGADAGFAQEGRAPIRRFPETVEELNGYDVVLFGDVDPTTDWLTVSQARMLVEFVGRGGGFGLIAGERNAPHRFRGTVLEKLVPVRIDPDFLGRYVEVLADAFVPRLTREGRRSRLFRFDVAGPPPQNESRTWVEALPGWYWFARTLGPKPGAEVLLEHPVVRTTDRPMPLVVTGRYGAGKTFFHGSDDTWRWRRGTGELIYDGYWIQVVRALSPARAVDGDARLVIRPKKRRYHFGERVDVQVRISDAGLLSGLEEKVRLAVHDSEGQLVAKVNGNRLSASSPLFETSFIPPESGTFSVTVIDLPFVGPVLQPAEAASIRVERASLESRRPEADHAVLGHLATQTGGKPVALDRLTEVFAEVRDRSVRIPDDVSETLWDSKLAFMLFAILITSEWILRKVYGMI